MALDQSQMANLPSKYGFFEIKVYDQDDKEHMAVIKRPLGNMPLVRIHSECLTGDVFGSLKCDCGQQLEKALEMISREGGALLYLRQEGRGIGLLNKINAYALQDKGFNTIEANHQLGFEQDERRYGIAEDMLQDLGVKQIRLITNNPLKVKDLEQIKVVELVGIRIDANEHNKEYLKVKKEQMGHKL